MSKELETLNKLQFLLDDNKCCNEIIEEANKYIYVLEKQLERKEKLEKVWAIFNTNHITYEHKEVIKKANNYKEYVDLYRFSFRITDLHEHLVEEDEFKLLKEMIE